MTGPATSGETWFHGETHTIRWDASGMSANDEVSIFLVHGDDPVMDVALDTPALAGEYDWTLGADVPSGQARVNVRDYLNDLNGFSRPFIVSATAAPTPAPTSSELRFLQPRGGEELAFGQDFEISWTYLGTYAEATGRARVRLYNDASAVETIAEVAAGVQYVAWTVPLTVDPGDRYNIQVWDFDNDFEAHSAYFAIGDYQVANTKCPNIFDTFDSTAAFSSSLCVGESECGDNDFCWGVMLSHESSALRECCGEHRSCDESKTFIATLLDVRTYSVVDVTISWVTVSTFLLAGLGLESSLLPMNGLQGLLNLVDIIMTSVIVSNVNSINDKSGYSYINNLIDANCFERTGSEAKSELFMIKSELDNFNVIVTIELAFECVALISHFISIGAQDFQTGMIALAFQVVLEVGEAIASTVSYNDFLLPAIEGFERVHDQMTQSRGVGSHSACVYTCYDGGASTPGNAQPSKFLENDGGSLGLAIALTLVFGGLALLAFAGCSLTGAAKVSPSG